MAINRYMPLDEGKTVDREMVLKLNRIFGSEAWKPIYEERKKHVNNQAERVEPQVPRRESRRAQ